MTEQRHHVGNVDPGQLALFRNIADAAAQEAVRQMRVDNAQTLLAVGIDVTNPLQAQSTMASLRKIAERFDHPEQAANDAWVDRWRPRTEGIVGKAMAAMLALCLAGAGNTLVAGARALLSKGP